LTHKQCHMTDVRAAVRSGVSGVNIYMVESVCEVIEYVRKHWKEVHFGFLARIVFGATWTIC